VVLLGLRRRSSPVTKFGFPVLAHIEREAFDFPPQSNTLYDSGRRFESSNGGGAGA
jgi:hypothetical protein